MLENKDDLKDLFSSIKVVLVGTTHPGNIGASARAMKNMGLLNLALVTPKEFPSDAATFRSKAAKDVLENAQVFEDLAFPRERFSDELLQELALEASRSITITDTDVIIHHLYTERRV